HADRLPALNQQRLVVLQRPQRRHDRVERFPVAGRLSRSAIHDEILRTLGDVGIKIVHQHAQRRFLLPPLARERRAAWGADGARPAAGESVVLVGGGRNRGTHRLIIIWDENSSSRIAAASRSMSCDSTRSRSSGATNSRTFWWAR